MGVRKYLFWMCDKGIKAYKVTPKGKFEIMKPAGRNIFPGRDLTEFFPWFHKSAAIAEDEYIDFCFLSDMPIESPLLDYNSTPKSSWDKQEVDIFCKEYANFDNYEVFYEEDKSFVSQHGDLLDKKSVKKLYLKCIPEFSIQTKEKVDSGTEETSLVNRFFIDKLRELTEGNL